MEFLIIFISLIVVYIIGKFIYDSFLTDNTERNWEEYQKGKIIIQENKHALDSFEKEKKETLRNLCKEFNSNSSLDLYDLMIHEYKTEGLSIIEAKERIEHYETNAKKEQEDSISGNIYTRSYYMASFLKQYIQWARATYIKIPNNTLIAIDETFGGTLKGLFEDDKYPIKEPEMVFQTLGLLKHMGNVIQTNPIGKKYLVCSVEVFTPLREHQIIDAICYDTGYNPELHPSSSKSKMKVGEAYLVKSNFYSDGEIQYEIVYPEEVDPCNQTRLINLFNYQYSLEKLSEKFDAHVGNIVEYIYKQIKGKDLVDLFELYLSYRMASLEESKNNSVRLSDTQSGIISNYIKLEIFEIKRELDLNYQKLKKAISENDYVFINTHENILIEEANYLSKSVPILNQINVKLYGVRDPLFRLFEPTIIEYQKLIIKTYNKKSKNSYNMIDDNEKKELVNNLFIVMDATVSEEINNNPRKGTPLEGLHIHNMINKLSESYKEKIREIANSLPIEITDEIVIEASNMVYDKYLE